MDSISTETVHVLWLSIRCQSQRSIPQNPNSQLSTSRDSQSTHSLRVMPQASWRQWQRMRPNFHGDSIRLGDNPSSFRVQEEMLAFLPARLELPQVNLSFRRSRNLLEHLRRILCKVRDNKV